MMHRPLKYVTNTSRGGDDDAPPPKICRKGSHREQKIYDVSTDLGLIGSLNSFNGLTDHFRWT